MRIYTHEFKTDAIKRVAAGENVEALGKELGVTPTSLYAWRRKAAGKPIKHRRSKVRAARKKAPVQKSAPAPKGKGPTQFAILYLEKAERPGLKLKSVLLLAQLALQTLRGEL